LRELGWRIGPVVTRKKSSARAAVRIIGEGQAHAGLTRQILAADVLILATPDDVLSKVAAQMAEMGREEWRGKIVLHTSGALSSRVLEKLQRRDAEIGSLHPLQSFTGREIPRLEGAFFAMEGSLAAMRMARRICRELGGIPVKVKPRGKAAYHAAGAFVAAFFLASIEAATRILMAEGFTRRQATRALEPLAQQTLENAKRLGARAAWTGPISRGDFGTVKRHVCALAGFPPEFGDAYKALSRLVASLLSARPRATLRSVEHALDAGASKKSESKGERLGEQFADSH